MGGQGRCEQRSEVFVIIKKNIFFGGAGGRGDRVRFGVKVDVNEELKFLLRLKKNWGVRSGIGLRGGGGGQVGCERRIEVFFVKIQNKKPTK